MKVTFLRESMIFSPRTLCEIFDYVKISIRVHHVCIRGYSPRFPPRLGAFAVTPPAFQTTAPQWRKDVPATRRQTERTDTVHAEYTEINPKISL